jgi:hypothetical protein
MITLYTRTGVEWLWVVMMWQKEDRTNKLGTLCLSGRGGCVPLSHAPDIWDAGGQVGWRGTGADLIIQWDIFYI